MYVGLQVSGLQYVVHVHVYGSTKVLSKYFRTFVRKYEGTYVYCIRVIYLRVCFRTRVRVRTMVYIQYSYSFIDRWLGLQYVVVVQ